MYKWISTLANIEFAINDRVATITLNRPEKRNALSRELLTELRGALLEADDRTDVSVILIKGAGQDFCSGYDVATTYVSTSGKASDTDGLYRGGRKHDIDSDAWRLERGQELLRTLVDIHKPVVARVHGRCLAGGMDLALYCDLVVAAEDAVLGFPAIRSLGTPPNMMWPYHVGPQWSKRMLFTGDCVTGRDAAKIGLVLDAYPSDRLDAEVDELVRRISLTDPGVLSANKRIVNLALELAGASSIARFAAEIDARAHSSHGPRQTAFMADLAKHGLKQALTERDAPYGDGMVKLNTLADAGG
jgi:enoyl-CoA hydratase